LPSFIASLQLIHDRVPSAPADADATAVAADHDSLDPVPRFAENDFPAATSAGVWHPRVGLLLPYSLGLDLRGIANPHLHAQFCE